MIYAHYQYEALVEKLKLTIIEAGKSFKKISTVTHSLDSEAKKRALRQCCICKDAEEEDMIQLESCRHNVHMSCIKGQLAAGWTGKRISFGYISCGECRTPLFHRKLKSDLAPHLKLKKEVEEISFLKCLEDNIFYGLKKQAWKNENETKSRCVNVLSCFLCHACKKPFCAGQLNCADDDDLDISTLNCASCAFEVQKQAKKKNDGDWRGKCGKHGYKHAMYKCDSCCSVAVWDCRSNHYCDRCHNQFRDVKNYPCPGLDLCPLGIEHPPNQCGVHGESTGDYDPGFVMGCFKCFTKSEEDFNDYNNNDIWANRF